MDYLQFSLDAVDDGLATLEGLASTPKDRHARVMAEVKTVLDWAWRAFPDTHGPVDEGGQWQHDLLVTEEPGGWHTVVLTLTGTDEFIAAWHAAFG